MFRLTAEVDPFIGVDGVGQCLCGPYLPNSLVRLGPDTLPPHTTSGYASDSPIIRFSHTHVNGTGGLSRYGNIGVTPAVGCERLWVEGYEREDETACPGYYSVRLRPVGILAELTSTARTGFHRYTFPSGKAALLVIDAGAVIQPYLDPNDRNGCAPACIGGFIEKASDREIVGRGDFRGGWGHEFPYSVFFYARANVAIGSCRAENAAGFVTPPCADGANSRIVLNFGQSASVELQVGISYVSIAKARASVEREIGSDSFETVRKRAGQEWEDMLSRIHIDGGSPEQRKLFYTLFTRLGCMPSDLGVNDEFGQWESGVRHFTDFCCLWDSVRNANSLRGLLDPGMEVAQLNCLLDIADKTGWLPDVWIAGHSACVQGGSSADILFCEAALKGYKGIDYEKALRQMRKNNEVESEQPYFHGRYLRDYRDLGYVSTDVRLSSVSRHLEYAYQDWCIGALARKLGQLDVSDKYRESSMKVWNLWREDIRQFGPRQPDGHWVEPFDPAYHLLDRWNDPYFYEGNSWQWSFNVQHDFAGLMARHGGGERFIEHLDRFFEGGFYESKETMLHVPYLYHYAGRPDLSAERVRWALEKHFHPTRNGLADNEDMGCQSAFYMCSAMGLYPLMGQDMYWLTTPLFDRVRLRLGGSGEDLQIETEFEAPGALYITSAELNGKVLDRAWIKHDEIAQGGTLRFRASCKPGTWGTAEPPCCLKSK